MTLQTLTREEVIYFVLEEVIYDSSEEVYYTSIGDEEIVIDKKANYLFPGVDGETTEEINIKNNIFKSIDKNFFDGDLGSWEKEEIEESINNFYDEMKQF